MLVVGGTLVRPGLAPVRADVALNYDEPVARRGPRVRDVGDLAAVVAIDTVAAEGLWLHPAPSMLETRGDARWLRIDAPATLTIRRGREATSELVTTIGSGT